MKKLTFNKIDNWIKTSRLWELKRNTSENRLNRYHNTKDEYRRYPYANVFWYLLGQEM